MSHARSRHDSNSSDRYDYLVKISGIPSSTKLEDIRKFLLPCGIIDIHYFENTINSTTECIVDLDSEMDVEQVLKKNGHYLNNQIVELHPVTEYEFKFFAETKGNHIWQDPVVRISNLPVDCTMANVQNFFHGIEIARNGIYITRDMTDEAVGGGFVAFVNMDNAYKAIQMYNKKYMGNRLITMAPSTYDDAKRLILNDAHLNAKRFAGEKFDDFNSNINLNSDTETKPLIKTRSRSRSQSNRQCRSNSRDLQPKARKRRHSSSSSPSERSRVPPKRQNHRSTDDYRERSRSRSPLRRSSDTSNNNEAFLVKMRGMPYTVLEEDIRKFFPSSIQPIHIEILKSRRTNLSNGNAYVHFKSFDDATEAMKYDRHYMGTRYVELYFDHPHRGIGNCQHGSTSGKLRRSSPSISKPKKRYRRRSTTKSDN